MTQVTLVTRLLVDISNGPTITAEELTSGQFQLVCACGWTIVTNPKYRLSKDDLTMLINSHIVSSHSDLYEQQK